MPKNPHGVWIFKLGWKWVPLIQICYCCRTLRVKPRSTTLSWTSMPSSSPSSCRTRVSTSPSETNTACRHSQLPCQPRTTRQRKPSWTGNQQPVNRWAVSEYMYIVGERTNKQPVNRWAFVWVPVHEHCGCEPTACEQVVCVYFVDGRTSDHHLLRSLNIVAFYVNLSRHLHVLGWTVRFSFSRGKC